MNPDTVVFWATTGLSGGGFRLVSFGPVLNNRAY